jgi:hypothetical protein
MALITTALVRTIQARDSHGDPKRVFVYQTVIHDGTLEDPGHEVGGLEALLLEDGRDVTALDEGRYQIDSSGEILVPDVADAV